MSGGDDAAEVVAFLALFARIKDWCDDKPDTLVDDASKDPGLKELCNKVYSAAQELRRAERSEVTLFTAPVNPVLVAAFRDYENRYEPTLLRIESWDSEIRDIAVPQGLFRDLDWLAANAGGLQAKTDLGVMVVAAHFGADQADALLQSTEGNDERPSARGGIAAWEHLTQTIGFEVSGVFRRRALVPFVFVPRRVHSKHSRAEVPSMLKNLQQAHEAFVYGATYAALALMRSIMEAVLRDHYRAEGKDLSERIRNARGRLPPSANEAALHRLRKRANAILHLYREKDEGLPSLDEVGLEREIVSLLFVLRALIEGAK